MAMSDRAFRALAQMEPDVVVATLRVVAPYVVAAGTVAGVEDVGATRLDALAPPRDVDWLVFVGADALLHLECQGYRDATFADRVFEYHLWLALRHPKRYVRTVALWLIDPPRTQTPGRIVRGDVRVRVTPVVLPRVPVEVLLDDARTVCFAPGADRGAMPATELCARVAATLAASGASWYRRHMAVVAAAMAGRYDAMVAAMEQAGLEPVIIEDLVKIGEDRGEARGELKTLRASVVRLLERRGLAPTAAQRERVAACDDADRLRAWFDRAVTAASADAVFDDDA